MITVEPIKQTELVEFLKSPSSYPDSTKQVEVKETHISTVFLTDHFAYKLKKSVRYDFLDFSTPELRRRACQQEVSLNRRLAVGVYLGVIPICLEDGRLVIDGKGEPVDWLVKMKRLDDAHSLQSLLSTKQLQSSQQAALANRLANFYANLSPKTAKCCEFRRAVSDHIHANRDDLLQRTSGVSHSIEYIHSAQLRFLNVMSDLFDARVCDGRLVDGHGDLKPEHIYFAPNPIVIDCIEFNPEYRHNDVIDELSFLSMECDRLNSHDVGRQIIDAYSQTCQDFPSSQMISFYKCYRACVRAKVAAFRAQQTTGQIQERYLRRLDSYIEFANAYARELGPKLVITVGGLMGTGKSTLAREITERLNAKILQTDVIRREVIPSNERSDSYGTAKYSQDNRERVYDELFKRLPALLSASPTVVLDGTFGQDSLRRAAQNRAKEVSAEWLHLECKCPAQLSIERINNRQAVGNSHSEARAEFYRSQVADYEPPHNGPNTLTIDTSETNVQRVEKAVAFIRSQMENESQHSVVD